MVSLVFFSFSIALLAHCAVIDESAKYDLNSKLLKSKQFELSRFSERAAPITKSALQKLCEYSGPLGGGSFATVHCGMINMNDSCTPVAFKVLRLNESGNTMECLEREVRILKFLKHENIVTFYMARTCLGEDQKLSVVIITELLGGDLGRFVADEELSNETLKLVLQCVLNALKYLHHLNCIHRDVKPANIMYSSESLKVFKLIDFGLCTEPTDNPPASNQYYCSPTYAPLEMLKTRLDADSFYSTPVDIYSLGICILLWRRCEPYKAKADNIRHLESLVDEGVQTENYKSLDQDLVDFIDKCVAQEPGQRATAEELLGHKYLQ